MNRERKTRSESGISENVRQASGNSKGGFLFVRIVWPHHGGMLEGNRKTCRHLTDGYSTPDSTPTFSGGIGKGEMEKIVRGHNMPNTTNILKRVYLTESILSNLRKLASLDSDLAGAQVTLEDLAVYVAGENPDHFFGIDDVKNQALTVKTARQLIRTLANNLLEITVIEEPSSIDRVINQLKSTKDTIRFFESSSKSKRGGKSWESHDSRL